MKSFTSEVCSLAFGRKDVNWTSTFSQEKVFGCSPLDSQHTRNTAQIKLRALKLPSLQAKFSSPMFRCALDASLRTTFFSKEVRTNLKSHPTFCLWEPEVPDNREFYSEQTLFRLTADQPKYINLYRAVITMHPVRKLVESFVQLRDGIYGFWQTVAVNSLTNQLSSIPSKLFIFPNFKTN